MLQTFLEEDIGAGDVTAEAIFTNDEQGSGDFLMKADGVLAGTDIIEIAYQLLDPRIQVTLFHRDGEKVIAGTKIATVVGPIQAILTGERVVLNLLQRLSGIATLTKQCVDALNDTSIRICDTRKTTPGLRMLEKYAVTCGGGYNHRHGLYDGVMIKDNHIAFCGSITAAVERVRHKTGHMLRIEVETESLDQVKEAVAAGADVIMFDNQTPEDIRELSRHVPSAITTEVSGGITPGTIRHYQGSGVDYISLGFLTHSAQAIDISFLEKNGKPE